MNKSDHVVMRDDGATCLHCGDHQQLTVPQNMESFVAVARAFERVHAKCPAGRVESVTIGEAQ